VAGAETEISSGDAHVSDDVVLDQQEEVDKQSTNSALRGEVLSALRVDRYVYVEIDQPDGSVWVAGPYTEVMRGDVIQWKNPYLMREFHSSQLNRTFSEIHFATDIVVESTDLTKPAEKSALISDSVISQGVVISLENVKNYTYLELKRANDANVWLAVPTTLASMGDTVVWHGGATMTNFDSESLGRTFPEIVFVNEVQIK
jgi:hypothetical protein